MYECDVSRLDALTLIPDSVYKATVENMYNAYIIFEYSNILNIEELDPQKFIILTCGNCGEYFPDPEDIKGRPAIEKLPDLLQHKPYYKALCDALRGAARTVVFNDCPRLLKNTSVEVKFFPIESGKTVGVVMRELAELIDARKKVEEAINLKNLFTANMSHEIRTPLSAIIGLTKLLEATELKEDQKQYLRYMNQSCNALMAIVNDILDYAKLDGGKINLHQDDFIIRNLIDDTCAILEEEFKSKNQTIVKTINTNVPHCCVGDAGRLSQVLINLLSNASKFTGEHGRIELIVKLDGMNSDNTMKVHFAVKDNGIGISKDDQTRLFQPYSQIDNSNTKKYKGAGLGLLIAKKLVNLMRGEIWVESDINKGATFGFYVLVNGCKNSVSLVSEELVKIAGGRRVLIVDDKAVNRLQLIKMVKSWGMQPQVASSVLEAELLLEDSDFALGLIDIIMPDGNGDTLAKTIRKRNLGFPIIALSSLDEELMGSVFTSVMRKPIDSDKLASMVLNILSNDVQKPTFYFNPTRKLKILSAEDYQSNQLIICNYLEKLGFHDIDTAVNGKEAVNKCLNERYDLIFMDIKMPIMDGLTAAKLIWGHYETIGHHTHMVALTAQAMEEDEEKYRQEGFDGYISKPINLNLLKGLLRDIQ